MVFVWLLDSRIIPNSKYSKALSLMENGEYAEAMTIFENLDGYQDSNTKIAECNIAIEYENAVALMNRGAYEEAILVFETLDGYADSVAKIAECNSRILDEKYNNAIDLLDAGNVIDAYEVLVALNGYKDSEEQANSIYREYIREWLKKAAIGDTIEFGTYEQDGDITNGQEPIVWQVLAKEDTKALVISEFAFAYQPYNIESEDTTWSKCTLRKWLNEDFFDCAFSGEEKVMIPTATIISDRVKGYRQNSESTQDRVFVLSKDEVECYFDSNDERLYKSYDYELDQVKCADNIYYRSWWLRSPGSDANRAIIVDKNGTISKKATITFRLA